MIETYGQDGLEISLKKPGIGFGGKIILGMLLLFFATILFFIITIVKLVLVTIAFILFSSLFWGILIYAFTKDLKIILKNDSIAINTYNSFLYFFNKTYFIQKNDICYVRVNRYQNVVYQLVLALESSAVLPAGLKFNNSMSLSAGFSLAGIFPKEQLVKLWDIIPSEKGLSIDDLFYIENVIQKYYHLTE